MASTSKSGESSQSSRIVQVNTSLYELSRLVGRASIQVVFFHGLVRDGDYSDAHHSTWLNEDGTCCWPQTWLVEEIPGAHVFSVSCGAWLEKRSAETFDLFLQAEVLVSDLCVEIGQELYCPVVLVGQSIGGLVIKELCCQADRKARTSQGVEKTRLENFLQNLKGIFYYATPHQGSQVAQDLIANIQGQLMRYFRALSTETARLNDVFKKLCDVYDKWQFANLGESLPTTVVGLLQNVVVVAEGSARGDNFNKAEETDHFSICRP